MNTESTNKNSSNNLFETYCCAYNELECGILIYDENHHIVFANDKLFKYLGIGEKNIYGDNSLKEILDIDIDSILDKVLEGRMEERGIEIRIQRGADLKCFLITGKLLHMNSSAYVILTIVDTTPYKAKEENLLCRLELDLATKALNKYGLFKYMHMLINAKDPKPFTTCMLDFDDFKKINDSYGHLTGDDVLKIFADTSRKNIRNSDIFGRYGGEEFVFVFSNIGTDKSAKIIERIQNEVKGHFLNIFPDAVSFSVGMLYVDPAKEARLNSKELICEADKLLYKAKDRGKNRIVTPVKEYLFI